MTKQFVHLIKSANWEVITKTGGLMTNPFVYYMTPEDRELYQNEDEDKVFQYLFFDKFKTDPVSYVINKFTIINQICKRQHFDLELNKLYEEIEYVTEEGVFIVTKIVYSFIEKCTIDDQTLKEDIYQLYMKTKYPDQETYPPVELFSKTVSYLDFDSATFEEILNTYKEYRPTPLVTIEELTIKWDKWPDDIAPVLSTDAINIIDSITDDFVTFNRELHIRNELYTSLTAVKDESEPISNVYTVSYKDGSWKTNPLRIGVISDVDYIANYNITVYNKVLPVETGRDGLDPDALLGALKSDKSGIIIINGPVGTGKTRLVSHVLGEISKTTNQDILIMNTQTLTSLTYAEYGGHIGQFNDCLIVCEDAFSDTEDMKWDVPIGVVQELTDGITSESYKTKILFISNIETDKIPEGMLRPGRCLYYGYIDKLDHHKIDSWKEAYKLTADQSRNIDEFMNVRNLQSLSLAELYALI